LKFEGLQNLIHQLKHQ